MRRIMGLIIAGMFLFMQGNPAGAVVFTVTATVPSATSVSITANSVTGTTWSSAGTALTFGTMTFDNVIPPGKTVAPNIWRAPNYFAIDVANNGGGSPNTTISYSEGTKPTGQTNGLGYKATATFKRVTYNTLTGTTTDNDTAHAAKALKDVTNENVTSTELTNAGGGWCRIYVGLADGATGTPGEPFVATDKPGTYTGTLTVTATVS